MRWLRLKEWHLRHAERELSRLIEIRGTRKLTKHESQVAVVLAGRIHSLRDRGVGTRDGTN